MGHTKPEKLKDLADEIEIIRQFPNLKEKGFGVFYLKSNPFLHFHDKEDRRWAHVKGPRKNWMEIEIGFEATAAERKRFLVSVKRAYAGLSGVHVTRK